jgi:hypothetical protein
MNKDDIMKLEGEEMDKAVAELVMGWHRSRDNMDLNDVWRNEHGEYARNGYLSPSIMGDWSPTTNIADAWEVVEKIPLPFCLTQSAIKDGWCAEFLPDDSNETINCVANTAQLAICRAALLAVI